MCVNAVHCERLLHSARHLLDVGATDRGTLIKSPPCKFRSRHKRTLGPPTRCKSEMFRGLADRASKREYCQCVAKGLVSW
eukprot:4169597-Prymnesium_polylepis.3